ncbi:MAG: MXAN_6521/LA_1396 family lipoprotein [Myxococcaceae bacterium]
MKRLGAVVLAVFVSGCSIVKASFIRDDWAQADQKAVKRLAVVVSPLPAGDQQSGEAWARIARRYVNQKRDFLVKKEVAAPVAPAPSELCGGDDAIEGVLFLKPTTTLKGDGWEIDLSGSLVRCPDAREAWHAQAAGSFPSKDPGLVEVTNVYVQEFGPGVANAIPPALNVLRPLLDTLPQPVLSEADVDEKLTLD